MIFISTGGNLPAPAAYHFDSSSGAWHLPAQEDVRPSRTSVWLGPFRDRRPWAHLRGLLRAGSVLA